MILGLNSQDPSFTIQEYENRKEAADRFRGMMLRKDGTRIDGFMPYHLPALIHFARYYSLKNFGTSFFDMNAKDAKMILEISAIMGVYEKFLTDKSSSSVSANVGFGGASFPMIG